MYQPVSLFIGLRYMRGQAADRFGRFISWLSTIGITLGVMALVIVLSIMNGFEQEMQEGILKYIPQAQVTSPQGSLNPKQIPRSLLVDKLKGVEQITSLITGEVVLQSAKGLTITTMLGINPEEFDPLRPFIRSADIKLLQPGQYNIILGRAVARQLDVGVGDTIRLIVTSASQLTPLGRIPSQRLFMVVGLFSINGEVESSQILVNQQDAGKLMRYPQDYITSWRLYLAQPLAIDAVVNQALPDDLIFKDWREKKGELFQAVHMEKNMMGLLISLIIAVAAFNIITSLGLLVMEKQGEIAILKTQGLTRRKIMAIFMIQGASAGIIGSFIGTILGLLVVLNLNSITAFLNISIMGIELPVLIEPIQIITIALLAMSIALLSTLYPSWRAANIQPAEALRYE